MRYYDPLLAIVLENISDFSLDYYKVKNHVAFTIHKDGDFKTKILENIGLVGNKENKLF